MDLKIVKLICNLLLLGVRLFLGVKVPASSPGLCELNFSLRPEEEPLPAFISFAPSCGLQGEKEKGEACKWSEIKH